ncbi:ATP-binding protein [Pseudonocardia sp. H11422]|uniref:ATP-binding protein n=1 Tax=Pseudonocardia sp. H11422 TaxID=2835866 RepID=UPI001BDC29DD|nr:ATP-binding protein [Pseudonocardia sp. H11422]
MSPYGPGERRDARNRACLDVGGARSLRLRYRADPHELTRMRASITEWAGQIGIPADVLIDLQLAVGEAAANGIEHAYRGQAPGLLEIDLDVRPRGSAGSHPVIAARVTDHGRWRPAPVKAGYRGRGLALIHELAEHVVISATGAGTQACFEIALAG